MASDADEADLLQCGPLETLAELEDWQSAPGAALGRAKVRFHPRAAPPTGPKVIHCHDLAGNYKLDRFLQGYRGQDWYAFAHWQYIDTFVYFGHALCVVPPPGWTDAAHRHGVRVLGTLLVEGEAGPELATALLQRPEHYAGILADMAVHYGFDGWLLNIEAPVGSAESAMLLQQFVASLTAELHKALPESAQVLWYDSVDIDGQVNYQNALTEANAPFFNACDGIYTNYFWEEGALAASAARAGRRARDVYVGVDVYGRGTFGGGGMNCDKAAEAARDAGVSLALFAPGWTWDKHGREAYPDKEAEFWGALSRVLEPRPLPRAEQFASNFDAGTGRALWIEGRESRPEAYYDLSTQQPQPTYLDVLQAGGTRVSRYPDAAFNGGCCLLVETPSLTAGGAYARLYACDLKIGGAGRATVSMVFAELEEGGAGSFDVKLALQHEDATGALVDAFEGAGEEELEEEEEEEVEAMPTPEPVRKSPPPPKKTPARPTNPRGSRVGDFLIRWCGAPPSPEAEDRPAANSSPKPTQLPAGSPARKKRTPTRGRPGSTLRKARQPTAALRSEEYVTADEEDGPRWIRRTYEFDFRGNRIVEIGVGLVPRQQPGMAPLSSGGTISQADGQPFCFLLGELKVVRAAEYTRSQQSQLPAVSAVRVTRRGPPPEFDSDEPSSHLVEWRPPAGVHDAAGGAGLSPDVYYEVGLRPLGGGIGILLGRTTVPAFVINQLDMDDALEGATSGEVDVVAVHRTLGTRSRPTGAGIGSRMGGGRGPMMGSLPELRLPFGLPFKIEKKHVEIGVRVLLVGLLMRGLVRVLGGPGPAPRRRSRARERDLAAWERAAAAEEPAADDGLLTGGAGGGGGSSGGGGGGGMDDLVAPPPEEPPLPELQKLVWPEIKLTGLPPFPAMAPLSVPSLPELPRRKEQPKRRKEDKPKKQQQQPRRNRQSKLEPPKWSWLEGAGGIAAGEAPNQRRR